MGYASPGGRATGMVSATWLDEPLITPVINRAAGYVDIRLPMRPNGKTVWIKSDAAIYSTTPYYIVINTTTTHLKLYKDGVLVLNAPAGVGTSIDPTPTGNFFTAFFANPDGQGYGPWMMMTSAHSTAIQNWSGTGDALVFEIGDCFSQLAQR